MQITAKRVRDLLDYCPDTGILIWKEYRNSGAVKGQVAGYLDQHGYIVVGLDGKLHKSHRLIWLHQTGYWPNGQIDHIDHNRSNNQWNNLADVTQRSNTLNRKESVINTSKQTGVYKTPRGKWIARICVNRVIHNLGTFPNFHEAVLARKQAELIHNFHINHGT